MARDVSRFRKTYTSFRQQPLMESTVVGPSGAAGPPGPTGPPSSGWVDVGNSLYSTCSISVDSTARTASQIGTNVFFWVSGSTRPGNTKKAVFGGDLVVSGAITGSIQSLANGLPYLVTSGALVITSASNGQILFSTPGLYSGSFAINQRGAYVNRPTAGFQGRMYLCTDAPFLYFDDGANWQQHGPIYNLTPAPGASASWSGPNFNITSDKQTFTMVGDSVSFTNTQTGTQLAAWIKGTVNSGSSLVNSPFTVTMASLPIAGLGQQSVYGIVLYDAGAGNAVAFEHFNLPGDPDNQVAQYAAPTFAGGGTVTGGSVNAWDASAFYDRIRHDGVSGHYFWEWSKDGVTWVLGQVISDGLSPAFHPSHYGVTVYPNGAATGSLCVMSLTTTNTV